MVKTFKYRTMVTIGDTNLLQNLYFSNFFKIQGIVRELWVRECVNNSIRHLKDGLILATRSAHCDYKKDFYLFDSILCKMNVFDLRKVSVKLKFIFENENTNEIHAVGWQEIVFLNSQHKICKMPDDFSNAASEYLHEND